MEEEKNPYVGQMKGRYRHGQGTYTYSYAGFRYSGDWRDGVKHGQGSMELPDGSVYTGQVGDAQVSQQLRLKQKYNIHHKW